MPRASPEICSGGEPEAVEKAVRGKPAVCNSLWEPLVQPGENGHRNRVVMWDSTLALHSLGELNNSHPPTASSRI